MKNVSLVAVLLILIGCTSHITHFAGYYNTNVIDFTSYAEEGFLFTPEPYMGEYQSLGLIKISVRGEAHWVEKPKDPRNAYTQHPGTRYHWVTRTPRMQEVLDTTYAAALSLGGNAIARFSVIPTVEVQTDGPKPIAISGYEVSGFVIKRD